MTCILSKSDYKGGLYQQPTDKTVTTNGLPGKYSYWQIFELSLWPRSQVMCTWPHDVPNDGDCPQTHTHTAVAHLLVKYKHTVGTQQVWTWQANKRRRITSTCVTLWPIDSRWETIKWQAPAQAENSHAVASIHKRQMFVRNTRA
jgi:hypothetical protein